MGVIERRNMSEYLQWQEEQKRINDRSNIASLLNGRRMLFFGTTVNGKNSFGRCLRNES